VGDNVAFALREHSGLGEEEIQRIVSEKLSLVDLEGMEHLFPVQLSGGMQKRAGVARALATGAEILLYDEPTTGLDPIISNVINNLIRGLQRQMGVTSIVITHDLSSAYTIADQIAFLYDGNIVEKGTPEAFQKSTNPYVVQFREGSVTGPIEV
jgi:phospholipid/cholesterol/gamma-HCH transport system ATP-binding protein